MWGVRGSFNYETGSVIFNNGIHQAQLKDMQHIILTVLGPFMNREAAKERLTKFHG
jgi:hypothetical protein